MTLLALASCTAPSASVELPWVGTVGDRPPAETTLVVEVTSDGTIHIEGRICTFDEYYEVLWQRAATLPATTRVAHFSVSDLNLLIDADRELPYAAIWRLLMGATVKREMLVGRTFFGARSEHDGSTGALALFAPYPDDHHNLDPAAIPVWSVELRRGEGRSDPGALYAPLVAARASEHPLLREVGFVPIVPADDVPWGVVLGTVDAAMRAGAETVVLSGDVPAAEWIPWTRSRRDEGPRDIEAVIAANPADVRPVSIWFQGRELGAGSAAIPELVRSSAAYAGQAEFRGYSPVPYFFESSEPESFDPESFDPESFQHFETGLDRDR